MTTSPQTTNASSHPVITPEAILNIFYPYVAINSESGTSAENAASAFVHRHFKENPYFRIKPDHFGLHKIKNDPFDRQVAWALVKGRGRKTAVFIHHFDVVEIEDFKRHKAYAFQPETLEKSLLDDPDALSREAYEDLKSNAWIFGRGTADMKGGGAIQMAIMDAYTKLDSFEGNLLLLAVSDEENLSAGMRAAAPLLERLRLEHDLKYVLMINSEPHQRKTPERGMLSGGSIGKILPFVYARGILAHAGKSAEGFNPVHLLSEIVRRTEMNPELGDYRPEAGEMSPPPTWLMARDSKLAYDVSMPLTAFGCLSVQPLTNTPDRISGYLLNTAREAAQEVAERVNRASDLFCQQTHRPRREVKWQPVVLSFSELVAHSTHRYGEGFTAYYKDALKKANDKLTTGEANNATATWSLLDAIFEYIGCEQPTVIIGVVPPYYPSVSHLDRPEYQRFIEEITIELNKFTAVHYDQHYDLEAFFTGISDLSYAALMHDEISALEEAVADQMPLYGDFYSIPFTEIARNAMPCLNIGPWGKDFHKISERVLKADLLERTPAMILKALELALGE